MASHPRPPYWILAVSLALTVAATALVWLGGQERDRLRFENAVQAAQDRLTGRFDLYVALLRGVRGLFSASEMVTRQEFHHYVAQLRIRENYPGIQGIGFTRRLDPAEVGRPLQDFEGSGLGEVKVWPEDLRTEHHAITYLEPLDRRNRAALGYDMFTEETRRAAMERARDTGQPALSGRVTLVQEIEGPTQPGFLIYVPVFRGKEDPGTVEERRARLEGFVYSPFRARDLFERLFGREREPRVSVAIYDGAPRPESLLFDGRLARPAGDPEPSLRELHQVEIAGRTLTLEVESLPAFHAGAHRPLSWTVLLVGTVAGLLIFAAALARDRAYREADQERRTAVTLSRMALALGSELDPERLLQRLTDEGMLLTGATFGAYFQGLSDEQGHDRLYTLSGAPPIRTTPLIAHTLEGRGALRLDDLPHSPLFGNDPPYYGLPPGLLPVRSYLALPVRSRSGAVLGGLIFGHPEPGVFREEHQELVEGMAAQAAVALDNARLFQEAREAVRLRDEFLSVASHELKTPLTTLSIRLEHLANRARQTAGEVDQEEVLLAVGMARRQVQRLSRLVGNLLDVSRITSGKLRIERERVDLGELAQELITRMEPQATRAGTRLELRATPGVVGSWDAPRLEQVLANLLDNALKYGAGKPVVVEVAAAADRAVLSVRDQGIGIDPERLPHIFNRFERAVSDRHYGGLGLGLYIARQIVEAHGGSIRAETVPGYGTTFIVELPFA